MDVNQLRYLESHEWLALEGETATIGITDFAVEQLTDLVFIDLPKVGTKVTQGETFGEVESVKAVSELYAPISGEVVEVNDTLEDDLSVLSSDAYGAGWMIRVKASDPTEAEQLLTREAYVERARQ